MRTPNPNVSVIRSSEEPVQRIPEHSRVLARGAPQNLLRRRDPSCRTIALRLGALAALCVALLPRPLLADDEIARQIPADVALYVEARDAADLLGALLEPELWTAIAELAGQPSAPESPEIWRAQIRRAVRMDALEAVQTLASGRFAFAASSNDPGDAVFISRPAISPDELVQRWQVPLRADMPAPPTYALDGNLAAAVVDGRLVFGVLPPKDGWMRRVLGPWPEGTQALADDPGFRRLLTRTATNPLAIIYSQSADGADAAGGRFLAALHRDGTRLHLTAVTDNPAKVEPRPPASGEARLIATLPDTTLLAWEGFIDYLRAVDALGALPERNPLRIALKMQTQAATAERFLQNLKGDTCLAIGYLSPPGRRVGAPPVPTAALIVAVKDAAAAERDFSDLVQSCVTVVNFLCMARNEPLIPEKREIDVGRPAGMIDVSRVLRDVDDGSLGQLQLCWAIHGDHLIIASHADWARAVIATREGRTPGLARLLRLPRAPITPVSRNIVVAQSGALSDLGQLWLDYLKGAAPHALTDDWWRSRQPGGGPRLGIDVQRDGEENQLVIQSVVPGSAADGRLRVGERIVGAGAKRFASTQPITEIQTAIAQRPSARWLDLLVRRGDADEAVRVPLPFINPVQTLRRAVAAGRMAQTAVFHEETPTSAGSRGYLSIELRTSPASLLTPPVQEPVGIKPSSGEQP